MAGPRLDEVKDNAFRLSSRLNSTWGGNFTDMVRSTHFLRIIEEEHLVENAAKVGAYFLDQLRDLQREEPLISAARGCGLFLAFDLPDAKTREQFWKGFFDLGVLTLRSGENSIRFRPALDTTAKYLVRDHALLIVVWARYAGQTLVVTPFAWHRAGPGFWRTKRLPMQLVRSSFLLAATMCFFGGLRFLPLAEASSITFLAPVIVDAIASGRQPAELTAHRLIRTLDLPVAWSAQSQLLGIG